MAYDKIFKDNYKDCPWLYVLVTLNKKDRNRNHTNLCKGPTKGEVHWPNYFFRDDQIKHNMTVCTREACPFYFWLIKFSTPQGANND